MGVQALQLGVRKRALSGMSVERAGFASLALLVLALPFEAAYRPLPTGGALVLTNLKLVFYLCAAIAAATLAARIGNTLAAVRRGVPLPLNPLGGRRVAIAIIAFLFLWALASGAFAAHRATGLKWAFDLLPGAAIWLAIPLWLETDRRRRLAWLATAWIGSAVVAALAGVMEVAAGPSFDQHLTAFKLGPTYAGPFLRLSGTFEYANIAGAYFALTVPVIVTGLVVAVTSAASPRGTSVSTTRRSSGPRRLVRLIPVWTPAIAMAAALIVVTAALLLTASRGALAAALAGAITALLALRRRLVGMPRGRTLAIAAAGLIALLTAGGLLVASPLTMLRGSSQGDSGWYRAAFATHLPATFWTDRVATVRVRVTNLSPFTWSSTGIHPFHLSYHWLYPSGRVAAFEGLRTSFPSALPPGQTRFEEARVLGPPRPGSYRLVWDVVEEQVAWFSLQGGGYTALPVRVSGPDRIVPHSVHGPSRLPETPSQPPRLQLWAAAVRMIAAHPLLGVGPDGFRLLYGQFARPRQAHWDTRIYANNLYLEVAADLGLVGALAFLGFLAAVFRGPIRDAVSGHAADWVAVAAGLAAVMLAHGTVDYLFGAHSIMLVFWIACGLAGLGVLPDTVRVEPC